MPPRSLVILACLLIGTAACVGSYVCYPRYTFDSRTALIVLALAALTILSLPDLRRAASRAWERLDRTATDQPLWTAIIIFVAAAGCLWLSAVTHDRDLTPRLHDEFSYHIQAQMLARGRLWMPPLPDGLGDFFESFHILVKPVYASIYFPGTALLYVPAIWTGAPLWITSILITAATATALFAIARELLGGGLGVLAALMLVATPRVRWTSTAVLSQLPAMLCGMLIVWTWMRWRREKRVGWAAALGAMFGWATIVRPFDLLAYAVPVGALVLLDLLRPPTCHPERSEGSPTSERQRSFAALRTTKLVRTLAVTLIAAPPFISLQFILNHGTTGSWFTTPYRAYIDQFQPGSAVGFRAPPSPDVRPSTTLQQKIDLFDQWARPQLEAHRLDNLWPPIRDDRLPWALSAILPSVLMLVFVPLGIVSALRDRVKLVIALAPFLFFALYLLNPYFVQHYAMVVAPAMILTALFGVAALTPSPGTPREGSGEGLPPSSFILHPSNDPSPLPSPRVQGEGAKRIAILACTCITLAALPELHFDFAHEPDNVPTLGGINQQLSARVEQPAVVLFRYRAGDFFAIEPVYNCDVAWPLDAKVIRAHDLGPEQNRRLIEYFAAHEPDRTFYLFDRRAHLEQLQGRPTPDFLIRLGRADELIRATK